MNLQEAKDAVAYKYFREKWGVLSKDVQLRCIDQVAELYADSKVKNLAQPDVIGQLPIDFVKWLSEKDEKSILRSYKHWRKE